ncbi:hypothetical protein TREMEDRAFT_44410 [Tremella mesenterica DSM 1558]|uniref:uncharacterized protein n=1 Tax=Tremella mesenterica (strain ATCC 24925 / CBS 8224 / DSM 1558 / NBRC 9311 / NRRL Y-6157 / RJB 2259-6 / UBC 559-6) TaxID=578456 RepID=UPI0003F4A4E7|nr:uncharacterized protein TREMEDRAFT_44410 [Tremella mesenterica DSM 1558]EIW68544.1 hypothetical protein TREMEDRAFT_44410 [Tremella mesenterica DSM 1558]
MTGLPLPLIKRPTYDHLNPPPVVVPPINFSLVAPGVYRSGHPNRKNFGFLDQLELRGIMYVEGMDDYRPDSMDYVQMNNLILHRYDLSDEADVFTSHGEQIVTSALRIILDTRNHPLLLHDDSGKSTVSLLCGLVRRMQGWSLTGVFAEADMFAGPAGGSEGNGVGEDGREYIAMFKPRKFKYDETWKPTWVV